VKSVPAFVLGPLLATAGVYSASGETIWTASIKCRQAPSAASRTVTVLRRGTDVFVQSRYRKWSLVLSGRHSCWIPRKLIDEVAAWPLPPDRRMREERSKASAHAEAQQASSRAN